jgi:hypothetical protein
MVKFVNRSKPADTPATVEVIPEAPDGKEDVVVGDSSAAADATNSSLSDNIDYQADVQTEINYSGIFGKATIESPIDAPQLDDVVDSAQVIYEPPEVKTPHPAISAVKTDGDRPMIRIPDGDSIDKERRKLMNQINQYYEFEECKGIRLPPRINSLPNKDLAAHTKKLRMAVMSRNTHKMAMHTYLATCKAVEVIACKTEIADLSGFTQEVANDPIIDKAVKMLEIEYLIDFDFTDDPLAVLVLATTTAAYGCHLRNTESKKLAPIMNSKVDPGLTEKYKHILEKR